MLPQMNEQEILARRAKALELRFRATCWLALTLLVGFSFVNWRWIPSDWSLLGPAVADQSPSVPQLVRAKAIEVVDDSGDVVMRLSTQGNYPSLSILDEENKKRIELGMVRYGGSAKTDSPRLTFYDRKGDTPLVLYCSDLNQPGLLLRDAEGENRIRFVVWGGSSPLLEILDQKGEAVWKAP